MKNWYQHLAILAAGVLCGWWIVSSVKTKPTASSINEEDEEQDSQNLLQLLYSIAEDKAMLDGVVHRSITCNHCQTSPVRGWRFKCANCVDFDLCSQCEALDVHNPIHNFIKIRIPIPPLANPRSVLFEPFYPGTPFSVPKNLDFTDLENDTHFDQAEILGFYEEYLSLSSVEQEGGGITKATFKKTLGHVGNTTNIIIDRMFLFFDQNRDEIIDFSEMVRGLSVLCKGSLDERVKYVFEGYDLNNDCLISRDEFRTIFKAYFHISMELVRDVIKVMEESMMAQFDDESSKPVSAAFPAPARHTGEIEVSEQHSKENIIEEEPQSPLATVRDTLESIRKTKYPKKLLSFDPAGLSPPATQEDDYPIIEMISQEAIEELVQNVFVLAQVENQDHIDFQQFQTVVGQDMNLLAWFEALGSIF